MTNRMDGQVALVTGGSEGIGRAVARALAEAGTTVVIASRNADKLQAAASWLEQTTGKQVATYVADLAVPQACEEVVAATVERYGRLDALLINHGGPPVKPFFSLSDEDWYRAFDLIVMGPVRLLRASIPVMQRQGGGRVVIVTSFTVKDPIPGLILSNALRAAAVNLIKTLAAELGERGILLNAVGPGYTATERLKEFDRNMAAQRGISPEEFAQTVLSHIPLRRYAQPEEVARVIRFLLSPENSYVTGQYILVDGGLVRAL